MGHDMCSQLIFEIQREPRTYILVGFKKIQAWCWGWEKNIVEIIVVSLKIHRNKYEGFPNLNIEKGWLFAKWDWLKFQQDKVLGDENKIQKNENAVSLPILFS